MTQRETPPDRAARVAAVERRVACPANPCASCPYRRDTPPGVWAPEEYRKLPEWDDPHRYPGLFLCHSADLGGRKAVCRGWLEVHCNNLGVRMAMFSSIDMSEPSSRVATKVPLYMTGAEACRAGLRGVKRPGKAARAVCEKLTKARGRKSQMTDGTTNETPDTIRAVPIADLAGVSDRAKAVLVREYILTVGDVLDFPRRLTTLAGIRPTDESAIHRAINVLPRVRAEEGA